MWEQAQRGEVVSVWTICAGDPPEGPFSPFAESLHDRWQTGRDAVSRRRVEDQASCAAMRAISSYFPIPDCIYRRSEVDGIPLYTSESAIFGPIHPQETPLIRQLSLELAQRLPQEATIAAPLALGGHVDHRLVRTALQELGRRLYYYADLPYVLTRADELEKLAQEGWTSRVFPLSDAGLTAWQASIAAHASQISTFWPDQASMEAAINAYCRENDGIRLWQAR